MLTHYVKLSLKVLLRRPFFTVVSLLGIAFTLLVLVSAAAVFDAAVGPYGPESRGDRILKVQRVVLFESYEANGWRHMSSSAAGPGLIAHVRRLQTPARTGLWTSARQEVSYQGGEKTALQIKRADAAYWEIMDFRFAEGRAFTADEDAVAEPVCVITDRARQALFGGEPAVGRTLETVSHRYRVVGVVAGVPRLLRDSWYGDVWIPLGTLTRSHPDTDLLGDLRVLLLAEKRSDIPRLRAEFAAMLANIDLSATPEYHHIAAYPETELDIGTRNLVGSLKPMGAESARDARLRLLTNATVAGLLVMLLPALNLINLNVSRIMERSSEIGVRKAFGAPSRELVRQFVVENVILALVGGALGLVLSHVLLSIVARSGWWVSEEYEMSYGTFLLGLAAAVLFGILSGAYPAWRMSRLHPARALRGGPR